MSHQRIVSAKVEIDEYYPLSFQFLVYDEEDLTTGEVTHQSDMKVIKTSQCCNIF